MKTRIKIFEDRNPRLKLGKCKTCRKTALLYRCIKFFRYVYVCHKCKKKVS